MAGTQVASLFVHLALNNQMTSALRSARGDFDGFHGRVRSGMQTLYTEAIRLAGAVSAIFGAGKVISTFSAFDMNLKNIQAVSKRTDEEMRVLGDQILSFAENTIYGGVKGSEAFYQIASAVPDATKQMALYRAGLTAAAAGQADLSSTIDFGIATMQSFGLEADKAQYVFDVLSQTVRYGRSSMDSLSAAMAPTANLVATIGVNMEEWGAGVSYMDALGATAGVAATRFQRMIISLLNPNATMEGIFGKLGVEGGFQLIERNAGSLAASYREIIEAIGGDKNVLMQAVGRQEAYAGALALTEDAFKSYLATFSSDVVGQSEAMLAVQMEGLTYKFERFKSQIEAVAIRLGAFLAPVISGFIGTISRVIDMMNEANPALLPFVGGMVLLLTTLVPLLPILLAVGSAMSIMLAPIALIGGILAGVASVLQRNLFGITDTIQTFARTVGAAIRPFTETIRIAFLNLFSSDRGGVGERVRFFFSSSLPDIIRAGLNVVGSVISNIGPVLMKVGDVILSMGIGFARGLGNFIVSGLASLSQAVSGANIRKLLGLDEDGGVSPLLERISLWVNTAVTWLETEGATFLKAAVATALNLFYNLGVWWGLNVTPLLDEVRKWLEKAGNWLKSDAAKDMLAGALKTAFGIVEGGVSWLESIVPSVTKWITDAADWIINTGGGLINGALTRVFSGEGSEPKSMGPSMDSLYEQLPFEPQQRTIVDRVGDLLVGSIADVGRRITESIQTFLDNNIALPDWARTIIDVFLTPLADAFTKLQDLNWDNLMLAGLAIAGFIGGLSLVRNIIGFDLFVNFLTQLDNLVQAVKDGDWGAAFNAVALGILALGGALIVFNVGGLGTAALGAIGAALGLIDAALLPMAGKIFLVLLPLGLLIAAIAGLKFLLDTLGPGIEEAWGGIFKNLGIIVDELQSKVDKLIHDFQELINKANQPLSPTRQSLLMGGTYHTPGNYGPPAPGVDVFGNPFDVFGQGRASGGPVWPGLFKVGEGDKPELLTSNSGLYLIPGDRGKVIPNDRIGMGGGTIVINGDITIEGARDYDGILEGITKAARTKNASVVMGRSR